MDEAISDARYGATVLLLPADRSEDQLDAELLAKATALGIRPSLPPVERYQRNASIALSDSSDATSYDQLFSAASDGSASADLTPHSSIFGPPSPAATPAAAADGAARRPKSLSFSAYEKLAASCHVPPVPARSVRSAMSSATCDGAAQSIFSVSTRRGLSSLRSRILRKKPTRSFEQDLSCLTCRIDFSSPASLRQLVCGHSHCADCLRLKIDQASVAETKMPPRCCAPIPASTIQEVAGPASQEAFLRAVVQFSTPCALRIFCPSASCGEFIPRRRHVDPKAPLTVACSRCHARVCSICKGDAHPIAKDCPEDADVEASKTGGGSPGWKRCYKCRGLVERAPGPGPLTCRCEARFCGVCGAVWDATVGCPNICGAGDDESARRDFPDDSQEALAAAAEREAAEARSAQHPAVRSLRQEQEHEMERLCRLLAATQTTARRRQAKQADSLADRQAGLEAAMRERHSRAAAQLEDGQIAEEMELRTALEQSERSIRVRIRHMEAYCEGLGRNPPNTNLSMPPRVVTEQNLRDLGRQYNLRDGMEHLHQAKINMMRDRQAKRMEELLELLNEELEQLARAHRAEREAIETAAAREAEATHALFDSRKARLAARWTLAIEVLCKELEDRDGAKYAPVPPPTWPADHVPERAS